MLKGGDGVAGMILVLAQRAASEALAHPPLKVIAHCGLACGTARPWAKRRSWQPQGGRVKYPLGFGG